MTNMQRSTAGVTSQSDVCATITCQGHGTCTFVDGEPICYCNEDYGGSDCSIESTNRFGDSKGIWPSPTRRPSAPTPSPTPSPTSSPTPSPTIIFVPISYQNLPGANYFSKVFNMYSGDAMHDKLGRQIYRFTYDPHTRSTGVVAITDGFGVESIFEVPKEFDGIPNVKSFQNIFFKIIFSYTLPICISSNHHARKVRQPTL